MRALALAAALLLWAPGARADVVLLTSADGAQRFQRAVTLPDAFALLAYVETEQRLTFCGPATLAAVFNSLGIHDPTPPELRPYHLLTQDSVFLIPANQATKQYGQVETQGMTLDELARFAANMGATTETLRAADVPIATLRDHLKAALVTAGTRIMVNYSRKPLLQEGDGHISPVAAYDAATDSFLVLDVARYKYPPQWITFDLLYAAMQAIDTASGKSRGVVILSLARKDQGR
jgi:hypothetical protein